MLRLVPIALTTPFLLTLAAAAAWDPAARSGRATANGQIVGTVEISAALASRRANFRIYGDARGAVAPRVPANELASELRNVVVYLQSDPGTALPPAADSIIAVMSQTGERFAPHVLPVVQGTRVEFPNYDDLYHNVFSLSRARTFDLGRYPKGATKSVTFTKPGMVQVFCHIHADMSGVVVVLPNRYYAIPDSAGRYTLRDVPPGDYTMVGWHERTKPVQHRVRVTAGGTAQVNFKLPLGSTPEP
jgi:plastocyanin